MTGESLVVIGPALRGTARRRTAPGKGSLRRTRAAWHCRRGIAALEFGILAPALFLIIIGGIKFGFAINQYMIVTAAAQQGAQTLSMMRGNSANAYTTAHAAVTAAATMLTGTGTLTVSMSVNGTACTSSSCTINTAGQTASVTVSYPCDLTIMGTNFGGTTCRVSATSAAVVQ